MSYASFRKYLETLGENAVRQQIADKTLMGGREGLEGLARAWLADRAMAREDARRRLISRILVVACGVAAATVALPIMKSWIK